MATIKIKFRPSSVSTKEGCICYRVIHKRVVRQITSKNKLYPHEWDSERLEVIISQKDEERREYLLKVDRQIHEEQQKLLKIIKVLETRKKGYTSDDVVALYQSSEGNCGFISYGRSLVIRLEKIGKKRTSETYATVMNSFVRFYSKGDIPLEGVNSDLMIAYESYLRSEGVCANSSSYYMRNLRAVYNRAVDEGFTEQHFPFKHVYTGIAKAVKRAIPLKDIKRIKDIDLSDEAVLDYARDMFLMSFYTRGMSVIDMAYLKKTDLVDGMLSYRRKKTGQQLFIKWEKPMQAIVNKYDMKDSSYLLPIIEGNASGEDARKVYRSKAHLINKKLKVIGRRLGLSIPLTLYVARHCWASIARSKNVPLSVISEGMGHDSERTTQIYLSSLDTTAVDRANSLIMKSL